MFTKSAAGSTSTTNREVDVLEVVIVSIDAKRKSQFGTPPTSRRSSYATIIVEDVRIVPIYITVRTSDVIRCTYVRIVAVSDLSKSLLSRDLTRRVVLYTRLSCSPRKFTIEGGGGT